MTNREFRGCAIAKSLQSCLTPDPTDYSLPGSSVYELLQAETLEWVAIPFFRDLPNPEMEPASPTLAGGFGRRGGYSKSIPQTNINSN